MKVSIIIPIYNVAPYIIRCLQSVESQTYHDIECILTDDCGTDDSMTIAKEFINNYSGSVHFQIVSHRQNLGLSAARNSGIDAAKGDYVFFMDSDDAITPDCIEQLASLAIKHPDADFVQGNTVQGKDMLMEGQNDFDVPEFCDDKSYLERIILLKTNRTAWNRLIKRSFLVINSLFFPVGLLMEDHYWTYFLAKQSHAAAFLSIGTYYYYNNQGSIVNSTSKASLIKRYSSYMRISDVIVGDLIHRNDVESCHRIYLGEALVFCMINLARLHSLRHWTIFWRFAWRWAFRLKSKFTWRTLALFICLMPPFCLMTGIKGWRWRLRQYIVAKM